MRIYTTIWVTVLRSCPAGSESLDPTFRCKIGWLRDLRKLLKGNKFWLRGVDLNHRPLGYEFVT